MVGPLHVEPTNVATHLSQSRQERLELQKNANLKEEGYARTSISMSKQP